MNYANYTKQKTAGFQHELSRIVTDYESVDKPFVAARRAVPDKNPSRSRRTAKQRKAESAPAEGFSKRRKKVGHNRVKS